jgi:hypothetical protein
VLGGPSHRVDAHRIIDPLVSSLERALGREAGPQGGPLPIKLPKLIRVQPEGKIVGARPRPKYRHFRLDGAHTLGLYRRNHRPTEHTADKETQQYTPER